MSNPSDHWAAAPTYEPERRTVLAEGVRRRLPLAPDGTIDLTARAWAVRGGVAE